MLSDGKSYLDISVYLRNQGLARGSSEANIRKFCRSYNINHRRNALTDEDLHAAVESAVVQVQFSRQKHHVVDQLGYFNYWLTYRPVASPFRRGVLIALPFPSLFFLLPPGPPRASTGPGADHFPGPSTSSPFSPPLPSHPPSPFFPSLPSHSPPLPHPLLSFSFPPLPSLRSRPR